MPESADAAPEVETRFLGEIRALDFQRYAIAVGDLNPIYFDDEAARAAGYDGVIAPPNYLSSVRNWDAGPIEGELQADGTETRDLPPEMHGKRMMGGGHELTFARPVYAGDVVTMTRRKVETYRKSSRFGELIFAVFEIVYRDADGAELATCRETLIAAEPE